MSLVQPAQNPGLFERYWPAPQYASRRALVVVLAVGLVGALTLNLGRPGLDWLLIGLALGTGAVLAATDRRPRLESAGWAVATVALLGVGTLRANGWLGAYCLVAAGGTGSVALAGGRTLKGLFLGGLATTVGAVRAVPWLGRGLRMARGRHPDGPRLGRALLVAVALVLVFGGLFASADAAFATLVGDLAPGTGALTPLLGFLLVTPVAVGAVYLAARRPALDDLPPGRARLVRRLEWALPLAVLDGLFLVFVLVQLTVLFGGRDRVLRTADLTYAQYARSGFWQLVVVTGLTLAVLGVCARIAPRQERIDRVLLRGLLGALAVLTLVIVASAVKRLAVYEQVYGYTRLRLLVGGVELWLGLVFVLILLAGVRLSAGWLPRVIAATAVLALLVVAAADPDRFVADRNVDRYRATGRIDVHYLTRLSPDAVPALQRLPEGLRSCLLASYQDRLAADHDDWRTWNYGRERARAWLAGHRYAWPECTG